MDPDLAAPLCSACRGAVVRRRGATSPAGSTDATRPSDTDRSAPEPLRSLPFARLGGALFVLLVLTMLVAAIALRGPPPGPTLQSGFAALELAGAALERHRARTGAFPEALAELVPQELASVPDDPFAPGQPLRYGRSALGRAVWSVGPDRADHDGAPVDPVTMRGDLVYPVE